MSLPPPGYPPVQQNRGPSCWAIGGIGCLVVIVVGIVVVLAVVKSVFSTKEGRAFSSSFSSAMKTSVAAGSCTAAMPTIRSAILRYHGHEGTYPPNLKSLSPDYLPAGISLHCKVDKVDDPSHVTYQYFRPTEKTPQSAVLMKFSFDTTFSAGAGQSVTQTMTEQITLGGQQSVVTQQTQTNGAATPISPSPAPSQ